MSFLSKLAERLSRPVAARVEAALRERAEREARKLDELLLLQGCTLARINAEHPPGDGIHGAEFKVFSQYGEDGILQLLVREAGIGPAEASFVEFGVQDYSEANTRFLLLKDHWRGLVIDGSKEFMDRLRGQDLYWRNDLTAVDGWIDRDNIDALIGGAGFRGRIGVLSVDIDGNDYWVWERISVVDPVIVVVEWNSAFGPEHAVSVPYDPAFRREAAHYSGVYWGASIAAFAHLGEARGYALVGSNRAGNNLFFVRRERLGRLRALTPAEAYVPAGFRDSRDREGRLDFLDAAGRREAVLDLDLVDVRDGRRLTLRELSRADGRA